MDFMRYSEWLLRSLDLSISCTNDANWFWSSRGGSITSKDFISFDDILGTNEPVTLQCLLNPPQIKQ